MEVLLESLKLGIGPSIVVAVYLVISKFLDNRGKNKQVTITNGIIQSFNNINNFLDYFTKNIINKEMDKCDVGIRHSFDKLKNRLLEESIKIIINNNIIVNKNNIIDNMTHLINGEYYVLLSNLKLYSSHFVNVSEFVPDTWKKELYDDVIHIIFNIELTKEQRIYSLQNKLENRINEYKGIILSSNLNKMDKDSK